MNDKQTVMDIVIATDLRFPGGNNASVVEEIKAQNRAGYTSGLLHLPSPVQRSQRPYAPRIRELIEAGEAQLILKETVKTRLLVIRHPTVVMNPDQELSRVEAESVLVVANQVPVDDRAREPYYDVAQCDKNVEALTGIKPMWVPIGPAVRQALEPYNQKINLIAQDWNNIIDVDSWHVSRSSFVADPPVIGRHSRGDWSKWPATKETVTAAYPIDGSYTVKVLGGVEAPTQILGSLPDNWVDLPFNSVAPQQFLKEIDFLVYYHHPGLIEAFGRTILEGLAAGAVAVVDPSFEETFGEACVYSPINKVQETLDSFRNNVNKYLKQSQRGVEYVRSNFSYQTHEQRIRKLIGAPSGSARVVHDYDQRQRPAAGAHIIVDPKAELQNWNDLPPSTVVIVCAEYAGNLPEGVSRELVPAGLAENPNLLGKYLNARAAGLVGVLSHAQVFDLSGMLKSGGFAAPLYRLTHIPNVTASSNRLDLPEWAEEQVLLSQGQRSRSGRILAQVRQKAPQWFVNLASKLKQAPYTMQGKALSVVAPAGAVVYKPAPFPRYPRPQRGFAIFIPGDIQSAPEEVCRLIAQRAAMSNAFTPALLAPSSWFPAAKHYGIPIEHLLTPQQVKNLGGAWEDYQRKRILEAIQVFQPLTVNHVGDTSSEQTQQALDIAENMGLQRSEGKG